MKTQVDSSAYAFERYTQFDRWASYYYQLRELLRESPETVLEVGVGDQVVGSYLARRGIAYTSADIAEDLSPDVVASITSLPFPDATFDIACAFEVLEHLPFEEFDGAVAELARVSKHRVILSLPHFGPSIRFEAKVPFVPRLRFAWKVPVPRQHVFNGQHYWEIGKSGYAVSRIRRALAKHFVIDRDFVPFENQYHHFFVLTKRQPQA